MEASSAEKARELEQCERDLNLTIERLINLRLGPEEEHDAAHPDVNDDAVVHHAAGERQSAAPVPSGDGRAEWLDRLMEEMWSAADRGDARARAARLLEDFGASVAAGARAERDAALWQNGVLKKAVRVQHRLDKEKEAANRELRRQLAACQERVRSLETDNYALSLYLRQAQPQGGSSSITGRFFPEVF